MRLAFNKSYLIYIVLLVLLGLLPYFFSLPGQRPLSHLGNIHGIPYPRLDDGSLVITEPLAHSDLALGHSPFATKLHLTITYTPEDIDSLSVGVRENSFWLSYPKTPLPTNHQIQTVTVTIPLTDKLPDQDRSLDLMFFATPEEKPLWTLHSVVAEVGWDWPTAPALKNYFRSLVLREKPL